MDGWEHGDPFALWTGWSGYVVGLPSVVSASSVGMTGNYALNLNSSYGVYAVKYLGTSYTEIYFALRARFIDLTYVNDIFNFCSGGTCVGCLRANNQGSSGPVKVYGDSSYNYLLATGSTNLTNNTTYHYSGYFKLADSGGRWVVYVDGVLEIDFTGDTKVSTTTTFDHLRLGHSGVAGQGRMAKYFDDCILDTTTLPTNKSKIIGLYPFAVGDSTLWTTSVSTPNWQCVNEIPPNDVDYVTTNTVNQVETYNLTDLPVSSPAIGYIKAVQVVSRIKKVGFSTPTSAAVVIRTNSTDYPSSSKIIGNGFPMSGSSVENIWETNPSSTGVAWDVTAINSLQIGIKSLT
jgi:hypothetical protein